ncbi:hypothetical protein GJ744_007862 [Endocarpon pusillum]|uniref:Uncharacterized protein n=1 Tax=Endocarpon pusillum TaxID=364733 RepID=A0A8H7AVA1_9EURO|nr:hypothetical protein GJ744_007862 [Endocarpon pusillum]
MVNRLVPDPGLILHSRIFALPGRSPPSDLWGPLEPFTRPPTSSEQDHTNLQIHSSFRLDGSPALAVRVALRYQHFTLSFSRNSF